MKNITIIALAMALGVSASAFAAATTDVSPIDKTVAMDKDKAGKIYNASHNTSQGYFWTDLGHATIKDADGKDVELYTPFIYHTKNSQWDATNNNYDPVHRGDGSEMQCKESMSRITVGEFDRIIKALYHNDLSVYEAVNGGTRADGTIVNGIKQELFTNVEIDEGYKNGTKYDLKKENGEVIGSVYDTDTNTTNSSLSASLANDGKLSIGVKDSEGNTVIGSVEGIASRAYVDERINSIGGGFTDTNTTNRSLSASLGNDGKLTIGVTDSEGNKVESSVDGIASRDYVNKYVDEKISGIGGEFKDTNTVTKVTGEGTDGWIHACESVDAAGNLNYTLAFNDEKLKDYVKENSHDTITTVDSADEIIKVTENKQDNGNLSYSVGVDKEKLGEFVKGYDTNTVTKVTGEGTDGWIHAGESVDAAGNLNYTLAFNDEKLDNFVKERDTNTTITDFSNTKDNETGDVTLTIKDSDEKEHQTVIKDVASQKELRDYKSYNEADKEIMKSEIINNSERISNVEGRVDKLDLQVKEVGAMSGALAALHPRFQDDCKAEWMMGMGHYKGKTALATGLAFAPDDHVMFTIGAAGVGGGEYMVNAGVNFALDRSTKDKVKDLKYSRKEVDQIVDEVKAENAELKLRLAKLEALLNK